MQPTDSPKVETDVTETPEQPDKLSVDQQTIETADPMCSTFPEELKKDEPTPTPDVPDEQEQKIAETTELTTVETSECSGDVKEISIEEVACASTKDTSELTTNTVETTEISTVDVIKTPEDSQTDVAKDTTEIETDKTDPIVVSATEEIPSEPSTNEAKVIVESQESQEVTNDESTSAVETKEEAPEPLKSESPTVQEELKSLSPSDQISEQSEPQTPMEVDEKSNEVSSQFVEAASQSSDSSDS